MTRTLLHYIVLFLFVMGSAGVVEAFGTEADGAQPTSGKKPNSRSTPSEKMIILGDVDQNGVKALAHLKEERKAMAGLEG